MGCAAGAWELGAVSSAYSEYDSTTHRCLRAARAARVPAPEQRRRESTAHHRQRAAADATLRRRQLTAPQRRAGRQSAATSAPVSQGAYRTT